MSNKENFKIIAINVGKMLPTKDTRKNSSLTLNVSKNLKSNQIYQFRNEYQFRKNDFSEVDYISKTDVNLYELKTSINNIPININAIVGGNGSGKSTLIELIYWAGRLPRFSDQLKILNSFVKHYEEEQILRTSDCQYS